MLTDKLLDLMNNQVNKEHYSSYLYLSMAAYFESEGLPGFANWMKVQSAEEYEHGMKFYEFINDRGKKVVLDAIAKPAGTWNGPADVFQEVLKHEKHVTSLINAIYAQAVDDNDYPTQIMLHWFINEQVEEEKNAQQIVDQFKMIGESKNSLMMLDHALGKRAAD
jgi:ferritin